MSAFEILCATMHQSDFSKIKEMNIHSDVLFANQADRTELAEICFEGHRARMVTTDTRGVGINRNLALLYAQGEICLLADDDVQYRDDVEQTVLSEFSAHPDADIIVFHLESTDPSRALQSFSRTKKLHFWNRAPASAVRIAFRLSSVKKANLWFTTLFGGGCTFPSGEDSMWMQNARKKGLTVYLSRHTIGQVSFETSTWFTGYDEKFFYGKGAYHKAVHPKSYRLWKYYVLYRFRHLGTLGAKKKAQCYLQGVRGYDLQQSYQEYSEKNAPAKKF